jgi:hypothetical protein
VTATCSLATHAHTMQPTTQDPSGHGGRGTYGASPALWVTMVRVLPHPRDALLAGRARARTDSCQVYFATHREC